MSKNINNNSLPKTAIAIFAAAFFIMFIIVPFTPNFSSIIPLGIGIPLVIISFVRWNQFDVTKKWNQTTGKVIYQKIGIENPHTEAIYTSSGHDLARLYFPYIKYSYEIKGKTYISDNIAFYRELKNDENDIKSLIKEITEPILTVYYDPVYIEKSTLIPKFPLHRKIFWYFIMSIGLSAIIIGLLICTK